MSKLSLAVQAKAAPAIAERAAMTGPGDLRDQHWLDAQIEAIESGVEAVVAIARNWTDGRNLSRLHPGVSAAEYVTSRVGTLGKAVVPVLLAESNWSNRQIAAVAGVSHDTVNRAARQVDEIVQSDTRPTLGADGRTRDYSAPRQVTATVIDDAPVPPAKSVNPSEPEDQDRLDLSHPDLDALDWHYARALRAYVAGIVNVTSSAIGRPPSFRKRHAIERALQETLAGFFPGDVHPTRTPLSDEGSQGSES